MKIETDINTSITASLIGRAVILMMMFVEILRTCVIVFIGKVIMYLMSQWPINFQYQSHFIYTDKITLCNQIGLLLSAI